MAAVAQKNIEGFHDAEGDGFSSPGFLRIKNKNYAVGLGWYEVDNRANAVAEARSMAARPNLDADLYCVRQGGSQFGLGRKADSQSAGMVSLGGALADARGGNWVGCFEVAGGYYLLAVSDGEIQLGTDKFYTDEMQVRSKFEDLISYIDGADSLAPASFGILGSNPSIEDLLGKASGPKLASTDRVGGLIKIGGMLAVVMALAGGYLWYQSYLNDLEQAAMLRKMQEDAMNGVGLGKPKVVIPPMPWVDKPVGTAFLDACSRGLTQATLAFPGWDVVGVACDGEAKEAVLGLSRSRSVASGGGSINWVRHTLDKNGLSKAVASPMSSDGVEVRWGLDDMPINPIQIKTPSISESRRYLQSWFEESFTDIQFMAPESTDFVKSLKFSFSTNYNPSTFAPILQKIPGLTIARIDVEPKTMLYTVQAAVHEEVPPPAVGPNGEALGPVASAGQ